MISMHSYFCAVPDSSEDLCLTDLNVSNRTQQLIEKDSHLGLEQHYQMKPRVPQVEDSYAESPESLDWMVFCDLLSGASWADVSAQWFTKGLSRLTPSYLSCLSTHFTERKQFQFTDSYGAIAPLEILWLKWRLLATVCDAVQRIHSQTQQPLLSLHPQKFRIQIPDNPDPLLPARWQSMVLATDLRPAVTFTPEGMPSDEGGQLFQPSEEMEGIFQAPEIPSWPLGESATSTVLVRSIERIRHDASLDEAVQGMVRLHILEDRLPASAFSDKDTFRVSLPIINGSMMSVIVWGQKVESADRGLVISGKTEITDQRTWDCLESVQHEVWNQAKIFVYRSFHAPCDLYSLGMLMLHTVLDVRGEEQRLESQLPDLLETIHKIVKSVGGEDRELLRARLSALLQDSGAVFSKRGMSYPGVRAQQNGMMVVSDDLWDEVLLCAFRLITRIPGFSFCGHAGDYQSECPQQLMKNVMKDVRRIGKQLSLELFGARQRNREILTACQQLRRERAKPNDS